jgi:hypothetical protein
MKMVRQSRYYPSEKSWSNSPAWAFEIPLRALQPSSEYKKIVLQCQKPGNYQDYYILKVPVDFLNFHKDKDDFFVREDHNTISLFLSARDSDKFKDLRGKGKVRFKEFLENS